MVLPEGAHENTQGVMCAIYTRTQNRAQQAEFRENDRLDAESGAIPRPMSLNPKPRPVPKPRQFKPQEGNLCLQTPVPTSRSKAPHQSTPASYPRVDPTQEQEIVVEGMTERELGLEEMEDEEEEEREVEEEVNVGEEDWLKEGSEIGGVETSDHPLPVLANDKEGLRELRQLQEEDGVCLG